MNRIDTRGEERRIDQDREPDSPARLDKRTWRFVVKQTVRKFSADQCTDAAAALTYYAMLSIFPALVAVFSLLGVIGRRDQAAGAVLGLIQEVAPGKAADVLRGPIELLARAPGAGLALVGGIVLALWSASGYVGAFSRAMNRIYEIEEGRPFWKLRPMQLLVTVLAVVLLAVVVVSLVLSGAVVDVVGRAVGAGPAVQATWRIAKWPLVLIAVVFLIALLYYATPNVKQPRFRWISPGAALALGVLAIGTVGFGLYVAYFSHYDRTYGSLAGVIVFLLWLWIANLALLFGGEFDAELFRGRQLQAGRRAQEPPPRDIRRIEKQDAAQRRAGEEAAEIRREHDG